MQNVHSIAREILRREGGYVNDPDDPGGATNHGVTIHTMRNLGLDLDGDGSVTAADVKALSFEQAEEIFIRHYFERPGIARLPEPLHASVFDMQVNSGANAIKILQELLLDMGWLVKVDGHIGPQTVKASHAAFAAAPNHMVDAYGIARRNYYYRLADRREKSRKFARRRDGGKGGWITRAEEFIAPAYRYSSNDHNERVSKWG